jgi:hypothetical protein
VPGHWVQVQEVSMELGQGGPTPQQLDQMMHQALATVTFLLAGLEKDKGEQPGRRP